MGIQSGDLALLKSAVMDDVPEGGGRPTGQVIVDGNSNDIFNDISELDRAGGRVNLRKVFLGVRTNDTEGYFGVNVIVADPYDDPRVSTTLFTTDDEFDTRSAAASRMEAYLSKGASYPGYLFGDHLAGQGSISLLQRLEEPLPVIGQTLVLVKNLGLPTEFSQYVRATDVSATTRTFTDQSAGEFKRTVAVVELSDPLQADFPGFDAVFYDSTISYTGKTKTYQTLVADAARYFGVVKLAEDVTLGDLGAQVESIYTQLVPSTRVEVPIADSRMNQQSSTLVKSGDAYSRTLTLAFSSTQAMFVGGSILPGSLSVSRGGVTLTDKGGKLIDSAAAVVGTIDYASGVLSLSSNVFGTTSGAFAVTYTPAVPPTLVNESISVKVTAENQRLSWVQTIDPLPAKGTLQVSYRALGQWYVLQDDGSGALRGSDSSLGAGSLNPTTGTITVTLGAMPDVGSAIVFTYVASVLSRPLSALAPLGPSLPRGIGLPIALGKAIKPGTLSISWNDGSARTAADASGVLTGNATGSVNYASGVVEFRPTTLPAKGTTVSVSITETTQIKTNVPLLTSSGSNWTTTLTPPLKPKTVELALIGQFPDPRGIYFSAKYGSFHLYDDGAGVLLLANRTTTLPVGTIDYSTGAVTIQKTVNFVSFDKVTYGAVSVFGLVQSIKPQSFSEVSADITFINGSGSEVVESASWGWWTGTQTNALEARYSGTDGSGDTQTFTFNSIFLPNNPSAFGSTVGYAAKVSSFFLGTTLYVRNPATGAWVRDPSPINGAGTAAGSDAVIGGVSGVLIDSWVAGVSSTPTGVAGATQPDVSGANTLLTVDGATFRTAVSPLVNGGFSIAGNWAQTGTAVSATANSAGVISTGSAPVGSTPGSYGVFGKVDYEMGLAEIHFGRRVPVSMEGNDDIIDISHLGLSGVTKIQSYAVQSDTLRYNAVGYSYLPLDPDILGLNPVRLPPDGRVPIFRPGTFAVIGNTQTVAPATYSNGATVNCGRERLSRVRLIGNDGVVISSGYTVDLDAGIVTVTNVSSWAQPVTVEHRIEDMLLVRDAQITGQLSFTRAATHDYPAGSSYVSSALVFGDIKARTSLVFDQETWTNVWSDSLIGDSATGTFNDATNPITVNNKGALTERWAVKFRNSTQFDVIGEHVGVIATGTTGSDCAPLNPETSTPYFTIPAAGWGLGWGTGNVLRFNTVGAMAKVWVARTILQGPETVEDDSFTLLGRGDVDRP